jgi:HEAT repeat protein
LEKTLTDQDVIVRREAARSLAHLGGRTDDAVPILAGGLRDPQFRLEALRALKQCGPAGLTAMIGALKDRDEVVRGETARVLGQMGPNAERAIPALVEATKDPERSVRREAVHALGRIGGDTARSVPALIAALKDPFGINRGEAAIALSRLGPQAKAAAPALVAVLNDESLDAAREAAKALVEIGPDALPALQDGLKHENEAIRRAAADVLKQLEPKVGPR